MFHFIKSSQLEILDGHKLMTIQLKHFLYTNMNVFRSEQIFAFFKLIYHTDTAGQNRINKCHTLKMANYAQKVPGHNHIHIFQNRVTGLLDQQLRTGKFNCKNKSNRYSGLFYFLGVWNTIKSTCDLETSRRGNSLTTFIKVVEFFLNC